MWKLLKKFIKLVFKSKVFELLLFTLDISISYQVALKDSICPKRPERSVEKQSHQHQTTTTEGKLVSDIL
ncbi:hypothetical protein NIES4075_07060 [Tolypothrix sp. NIES-4075]|uniref:hypothetical protein n=1 Tax=Tolypothrix sp. NIES-4075 TaxID=2005459 RepID=UPI000B5C99F4|nr:hypothetical protein [Tolypothrix sp. NIES-4075]GAX39748.1 hypothetical protein NIES4075_07060 [Tolypothrix sp. NIES-4075]